MQIHPVPGDHPELSPEHLAQLDRNLQQWEWVEEWLQAQREVRMPEGSEYRVEILNDLNSSVEDNDFEVRLRFKGTENGSQVGGGGPPSEPEQGPSTEGGEEDDDKDERTSNLGLLVEMIPVIGTAKLTRDAYRTCKDPMASKALKVAVCAEAGFSAILDVLIVPGLAKGAVTLTKIGVKGALRYFAKSSLKIAGKAAATIIIRAVANKLIKVTTFHVVNTLEGIRIQKVEMEMF